MVVWLIGMSGAGKTTVGWHLVRLWRQSAPNTLLVDGDDVRALFKHDMRPDAHAAEGRRVNAERITELCAWLDAQGMNVVCAILSIFPKQRRRNRDRFSRYFEVYLKVPMDELRRRDSKGLYAAAERGDAANVVGVDIPFPEPEDADMVVNCHGPGADPEKLARDILAGALSVR